MPPNGWCWGIDGRNTFVLRPEEFAEENLRPHDLQLVSVRCELWGGCAWINLDDDAPALRDCIEPFASIYDAWKGRAGRGPKGGAVIIQTRVPKHHAIVHAVTHDYEAFAREELDARNNPPYPPLLRLANIVFSGIAERPTADLAIGARDWLERLIARHASGKIVLVGAAPCAIEKIKNRWRWHLVMKSDSAGDLTRVSLQ